MGAYRYRRILRGGGGLRFSAALFHWFWNAAELRLYLPCHPCRFALVPGRELHPCRSAPVLGRELRPCHPATGSPRFAASLGVPGEKVLHFFLLSLWKKGSVIPQSAARREVQMFRSSGVVAARKAGHRFGRETNFPVAIHFV